MRQELYEQYFKGKKVTVLGLGLLGRGVGDTAFLAELCDEVIVTDKKSAEELQVSQDALNRYPNITYHLGGHEYADFEHRDFVLKAAGVSRESEYVLRAEKNSIPVYMSAALLCRIVMDTLPGVTIIGVTGTRGKSTTTHLIHHILKTAGLRTHLGGNVRGIANFPLLKEIEDGDYLILELDSWQLQGFETLSLSPHIAVFTSFLDDHMVYYNGDKESYFSDKANIYRFQKEYDSLVASTQASDEIKRRDQEQEIIIPEHHDIQSHLIGEHNNVAIDLAYEVASQCGLGEEEITSAIASFMPVDGRLQDMGLFRGVRVFNDNNATTPDATVAGIKAVNETYNQKPILVVGGKNKGLSVSALEEAITTEVKEVVYLAGTGTDTLNTTKAHIHDKLEDCIKDVFSLAQQGDIILFSPGFASFSQYFNNEYERNDCFVKEVQKFV